jgi:hypothetical protein
MSIRRNRAALSNMLLQGRNEFGRRQLWQLFQFAPNDHATAGALLELLSRLAPPLRGYDQCRSLEIFSRPAYNTASAEITDQIRR